MSYFHEDGRMKELYEIIADKDAEIKKLKGAITDAIFEIEESYTNRAYEKLLSAIAEPKDQK